MADSASGSYSQSDTLGLRHISSSFFNIPGFLVGFGSRASLDSDSARSPTSPLDFSFFSNLNNPFSHRSPRLPSHSSHKKKWDCSKVGLGIVNLLANETKPTGEVLHSPKRKSIIFGPEVKTSNYVRPGSLPINCIISQCSETKTANLQLGKSDAVFESEGDPLEPKPFENSSVISLSPKPSFSSKKFCSEKRATTVTNLPLITGGSSQIDNYLVIQPSSLPIPIDSGHEYVGSLSAREIALSEDYTCIISHGPNPKTTHIFGDCILECHMNELSNFDKTENLEIELPQEAERLAGLTPFPSDEFLSSCYSCKKKLEKGDDIYMYRYVLNISL